MAPAAKHMVRQPSPAVGFLEVAPTTENHQRQGCPLRAEAQVSYPSEAEPKGPGQPGSTQDGATSGPELPTGLAEVLGLRQASTSLAGPAPLLPP